MRTLITAALLCSLSWISVSESLSQTVEVQRGEEVTLTCDNISGHLSLAMWFRLTSGTKLSCISSMYGSEAEASFCVGFRHGFEMSSNISTVFLKIKRVNLSDSGRYFCGFYIDQQTVFAKATHLIVQGNDESDSRLDSEIEKDPDGMTNLMSVILAGLSVFLTIVVIVLVVKIRKLQTAVNDKPQAERNQDPSCEELNSAERRFLPKSIRSRKPASGREVETHVIYAASFRKTL